MRKHIQGHKKILVFVLGVVVLESMIWLGPYISAVDHVKDFVVTLAVPGPEPITVRAGHSFNFYGKNKIQVSFNLAPSHVFRNLYILPDDCVTALFVNGQSFKSPKIPFCDYTNGMEFDLSPLLKPAQKNLIQMEIENLGGPGKIYVLPRMKKKFCLIQNITSLFCSSLVLIFLVYPLKKREDEAHP